MYYYILYMSYYPLLNYNWKDTSGNILPIANNYFAYGTLGEVPNNASSNGLWYSLKVDKVFNANSPSKIVDVYPNNLGNGLTFNVSGIYQITTTLKFTGSGTTRKSGMFTLQGMYTQNFAFSYSTAVNRAKNLSTRVNEMAGPIARTPLITTSPYTPTNFDTTPTPYFISGFASGGSTNGFDTTNCGGNVCLWKNNSPFFILPNYMSAANTSNVNTITALYYIPAGQTIYFNISDTVSSSGNPDSTLTATGNFTVTLLNTNKALGYPLYNWIPTNYSTFVYGTLNQRADNIVGSAWGSLFVNSNLYGGTNNVVSLNNTGLKFNVSGFYQLTTNLDLMADNNNITSGVKPFVFAYSTVSNTNIGFSYYNNWISGPIAYFNNTTTFDTTKPYFITGKSCGGNANFSNGFESVSYGGNIGLATNTAATSDISMNTIPFFILPNYHDGSSLLADNINTINAIYYIPADTTLYFNIGCDSTLTGTKIFNANGNFTVNLLSTIGSVNNFPLLNYNWTKSSNKYPIVNSCFVYGTIGKIFGYGNGTSVGDGLDWDSLRVNSIDGTSIATTNAYSSVTSMNNLVTSIKNFNPSFSTIESYATYGLKFNVSGIYQITTTLQFTGTNDSGSQQITSGVQTFAFSYSKAVNFASTTSIAATGTADRLSSSRNEILGPITVFDGSSSLSTTPYFINGSASGGGSDLTNGFDSTYFGGNICILPNATTTSTLYPPFFIMPNYMTTIPANGVNNGVNINTINAIYYIPAGTNIYFNIANTTQRDWLNANGNFTIKLLNYVPNFVNNNTNLTVSELQYSNGYMYYTFVSTSTTTNGTATITFPKNVEMNYLLVGGGGGGSGSVRTGPVRYVCGSGGGGGQAVSSSSPITGQSFSIFVGNAGAGASTTMSNDSTGMKGGDTYLSVLNGSTVNAIGGNGGIMDNSLTDLQPNPISAGGNSGNSTSLKGGSGGFNTNDFKGNGVLQTYTTGSNGSTISLSLISQSYSVGGAGGGGGPVLTTTSGGGGSGGNNATGGIASSITYNININPNGGTGSGYGTGGGGAGVNNNVLSWVGGNGGPGFAVLYWKA